MADPVVLPMALVTTLACLGLNLWADMRIGAAYRLMRSGRADAAARVAAVLAVAGLLFIAARTALIAGSDDAAAPVRPLGVGMTLAVESALAPGAAAMTFGHVG